MGPAAWVHHNQIYVADARAAQGGFPQPDQAELLAAVDLAVRERAEALVGRPPSERLRDIPRAGSLGRLDRSLTIALGEADLVTQPVSALRFAADAFGRDRYPLLFAEAR